MILEQVKKSLYWGQIITADGKSEVEIRNRLEIARSNFMKMKKLTLELTEASAIFHLVAMRGNISRRRKKGSRLCSGLNYI